MKLSLEPTCSCIVPFYNEDERVIRVLKSLSKVPALSQVICVDDGSTSPAVSELVRNELKDVTLIRLQKNKGKSAAVAAGLRMVKTPYVMLMDADLSHIIPGEIESAITKVIENKDIDMLIMRGINDPWFSKLIRGEILTSGQRILRTDDLHEVIVGMRPQRYQLEYAINFYMMRKYKKTYWISCSAKNFVKIHKIGLIKGLTGEIAMYIDMIRYVGVILPIKSLIFFCKSNIDSASR